MKFRVVAYDTCTRTGCRGGNERGAVRRDGARRAARQLSVTPRHCKVRPYCLA